MSRTNASIISLIIIGFLLVGCQPTVYLMPTPEALKDERFDIFAVNPNLDTRNEVDIFYATTRIPKVDEKGLRYTRSFDSGLRFGTAELKIGSDEQTWDELYAQSTTEERRSRFKISLNEVHEIGSLGESDPEELPEDMQVFFGQLNEAISKSPISELTIYVHGANSGFYRASAQGAQYLHFTGRNAVVLLFSWPSAENIARYRTDVKQSLESAPDFKRLVKLLARYTKARRINIIAYSAGARVVDPAMVLLAKDYEGLDIERTKERLRLGEIYYAAPDRELNAFINDLPHYIDLPDRITLTASPNDPILIYASRSDEIQRVGSPMAEGQDLDLSEEQIRWAAQILSTESFDLIDLSRSQIPGYRFSHGAWYDNPWVSTDTLITLNLGLPPEQRGLESYKGERGADIWYFPADYLERLKRFLLMQEQTKPAD